MMLLLMVSLLGADPPFKPRALCVQAGNPVFEEPADFIDGDVFFAPVACVRRRGGPIETKGCSFPVPKTLMTLDGVTVPVGGRATIDDYSGDGPLNIRGLRVRGPGAQHGLLVSTGVDAAAAVDVDPELHRTVLLERSGTKWEPHGTWRLLDLDRNVVVEAWVSVKHPVVVPRQGTRARG